MALLVKRVMPFSAINQPQMNLTDKKHFLTVKDFSVSKEIFDLHYDATLDMLVTYPQPELNNLGRYYESVDYISHTDSKRSLFEKAYHFVKVIALKTKLELINTEQTSKGQLLDIGAGTGDFLLVAKNNGITRKKSNAFFSN